MKGIIRLMKFLVNNSYIKISVSDMTIDVNGNYAEVRYRQNIVRQL
ncbi:MAG: hypothetical protein IPG02_16515 [Ignavibacteria bacterium]|nr:hypothetical protein [Ignavibacteria bacterium]